MDLSLPFSLTLSSISLIYELSIAFNTNLNYFKRRILKIRISTILIVLITQQVLCTCSGL